MQVMTFLLSLVEILKILERFLGTEKANKQDKDIPEIFFLLNSNLYLHLVV